MLTKLKAALSFAPTVDYVDCEDGLVTVRSKKALSFEAGSVKLRTSQGTMMVAVDVESFDATENVYRLKVKDGSFTQKIGIERREDFRLTKVLRATSQYFPKFSATTEDISVSGLRLTTHGGLEREVEIPMTLELDDSRIPPLTVHAVVAWTGEKADGSFQSGLKFTAMHPETERLIKQYIKSRQATKKRLHTLEEVDPFEMM